MKDHTEVRNVMDGRFERLGVLADAVLNLAEDNHEMYELLNIENGLARQLHAAAAFILTEINDAKKEFEEVAKAGDA